MRGTLTIANKDFKGFFVSPTFWMVSFLCCAIFSWVYPISLNMFSELVRNYIQQQGIPKQQLNIHYGVFLRHISYLNLMLIFIVPALTMRLLAEEKKLRTYDLLLTSPVTSLEIVAGKYLAVLGAIVGIIVISLLYPIVTSLMASVQWVPLLVSFFGIFLVAAVYAAMNLFCSALTESIIVAYVMSVIFNVAIWFIGVGVEVVDSPTARQIFEHISLNNHLSGLVEGTIRSSGLVFFISVIALFGFLAERVVESSRWR
jgi:ABC-2 type transport system permease protein